MKTIDLHIHSTFSDGTDTPDRLARLGKEKELSAMALTDHDTTKGIDEFTAACRDNGIEGIAGIELSSLYCSGTLEKEIHMVGLFIDPHSQTLSDALAKLVVNRERRNKTIVRLFHSIGITVDLEEMKQLYPNAVLTRAHFADYLLRKGLVGSRNEAFDRYLGDGKPCHIRRETMSATQAIDLIHAAGGLAILAHPLIYKLNFSILSQMVAFLAQNGMDGMEAMYSTFSSRDEADMKLLAKKNRLLISGGSDYHGSNKPHISLGTGKGRLEVPYGILRDLKNALHH